MCKCMLNFMKEEVVSFLRGDIDWDLWENEYKKCEGTGCPHLEEKGE